MKTCNFTKIFVLLLSVSWTFLMLFHFPTIAADKNTKMQNRNPLRIVTYNIRACRGLDDSAGLDPHWAGDVLKDIEPDVAGIQEVDRNNSRSNGEDQIEQLAEITGLSSFFAKSIGYAQGEYGIALLTKLPIISARREPLPGNEEERVLLEVEFEDFILFNTHLSLTPESRVLSAEIIQRELSRYQKPVILVGDMNMSSFQEALDLFGETWTFLSPDEPSFPADNPTKRLDYIMIADPTGSIPAASPIWDRAVIERGVIETTASDHRPVFVDLDLTLVE